MEFKITEDRAILFDGAMGTMLQKRGLKTGEIPETLNITRPEVIQSIHREYLEAGADVVLACTFGANRFKAEQTSYSTEEMVSAAMANARKAVSGFSGKFAALDIGPCGHVIRPSGDMEFEEAVSVFSEVVRAGVKSGADLILLETFTDLRELKAAVIAAKENSDLPLLATMSFEANGRTFFGTTIESMVLTLEGLGVDALGVNCSLGPKQLVPIVHKILDESSIPVLVQPNAGLPSIRDGMTRYDVTAEEFAGYAKEFVSSGVSLIGGCCGTTPEYIKLVKNSVADVKPRARKNHCRTGVCTPSRSVFFGGDTVIIGERLNPTGKKALQAALRADDMDFVMREAVREEEQGAGVLDVNMGLPDLDEPSMLVRAVEEIQGVTDLPLQLDSSNYEALERAARAYNGKPIINSVNGKADSLAHILPIAKKYGCAVLGLTLDDKGIPQSAEERFSIAVKIAEAAENAGIPRSDVLIDCLVMTASAQQEQAAETLRAVRLVSEKLGLKTVLGVSNVSFGLPARPLINRTMLSMALAMGLDAPIMNPGDAGMAETVAAFRVLTGRDADSAQFIEKYANYSAKQAPTVQIPSQPAAGTSPADGTIAYAISRGLKHEASCAATELLKSVKPLDVIEKFIVPALDTVGKDYETGRTFLPQLIKSADAAKAAFDCIRAAIASEGAHDGGAQRKTVVLATVRGDIHDIGKNIVKVIMENYNFNVIDLGRDVPCEAVAEAAKKRSARIVGLSALMTTSVAGMKETISLLHTTCPGVKVIVGGAVLTPSLAKSIGADYYAKDAMESVRIAENL